MTDSRTSLPAIILIKFALNTLMVWVMSRYLEQYFVLQGGLQAIVVIGSLLTLMNLFVRPLLNILTLPLKLFGMILALVLVNGLFLAFTILITDRMDPAIVILEIHGGVAGWIAVAAILGIGNWMIRLAR
jgi:putative membrane protein